MLGDVLHVDGGQLPAKLGEVVYKAHLQRHAQEASTGMVQQDRGAAQGEAGGGGERKESSQGALGASKSSSSGKASME